jgi:hypothetical protein
MWKERFPFWLPLLTTVMIASVFAAWDYGIVYFAEANFMGVERAAHECRVAADIAAGSIAKYDAVNAELTRQGIRPLSVGINPNLRGVSQEAEEHLAKPLPARLRALFRIVPPLDCTAEFSRKGLLILHHVPYGASPDDNPGIVMMRLSRPVFTTDGRTTFVEVGSYCGYLCGEGFDTRWRLLKGRWVLDRSKATWVS